MSASTEKVEPLVQHISDIPGYAPDAHVGTTNVRLTDRNFCPHFELVLGKVYPGGSANSHSHDKEWQVVYVISGEGLVTLDGGEPIRAGAGTVIRIPPGVEHGLVPVDGEEPWQVLIVYSPPIARDWPEAPRGNR